MFKNVCVVAGTVADFLWQWPLVLLLVGASLYATYLTRCIQVRCWWASWGTLSRPEQTAAGAMLTPFQAFLNTLSASMGNGSAAGMATALYSGGPGVGFWIFVIGFFALALRAVEVFASTYYVARIGGVLRGGPFIFLRQVPGGTVWPTLYALCCLFTSFVAGCAMQCNSMSTGIQRLTGSSAVLVGLVLCAAVVYSITGGARRIVRVAERVIPLKVMLFFVATLLVLLVNWRAIPAALMQISAAAFSPRAVLGVAQGYTIWTALRFGLARSISATETGLGTAGILFGSTGTPRPLQSALMAMPALFLSNHVVCCALILVFMVTGVWNSGLTGMAMTCAAYETVFGSAGALLVTLLSVTFGFGVLVAYALIGRAAWEFLCGARYVWLFNALFCSAAWAGTLLEVTVMWQVVDVANGFMLLINVLGLMWLMREVTKIMCSTNYE